MVFGVMDFMIMSYIYFSFINFLFYFYLYNVLTICHSYFLIIRIGYSRR